MKTPAVILASTSPYRSQLLAQLGIPFRAVAPAFKESALAGETADARALRLAKGKAQSVAAQLAEPALVLGSDQVCHLGDQVFSKPGSRSVAISHLRQFSGHWVSFSTSLVLLTPEGQQLDTVETFRVRFRELQDNWIEAYLDQDEPYDCAGAIKVERTGIALLSDMQGRDINALYGLPLIALCDLLARLNLSIFDFNKQMQATVL